MKRRLVRLALAFLVLLFAVWIALSPRVSPGLYNDRLFEPQAWRGSLQELREFKRYENREIFFAARSGESLHGWLFLNPTSDKIIIFHQGNAGDIPRRLPLITLLLDSGASVFIYEPRGFGLSQGSPSVSSICEDGESAYDYVARLGYKPEQIVIYGESLGAAVATHVSTVKAHAGIILQSGFASLERIGKERVPALNVYPGWMFPNPRLDNAALMSRPHKPLLVLHGEKDTFIDISHSDEIYARACGPKEYVRFPNSGHSDVTASDSALFIKTVSDFLKSLP